MLNFNYADNSAAVLMISSGASGTVAAAEAVERGADARQAQETADRRMCCSANQCPVISGGRRGRQQ